MAEKIEDPVEDQEDATGADQEDTEDQTEADPAPSQNPVKEELERVRSKGKGKTELERAIYTRNQVDKRIKELSGETETNIEPVDEDDEAPVTVGMLKKRELEQAAKTSLKLADEIEDEDERELTKYYLENNIKPSGSPTDDLRIARTLVNSKRNNNIVEEISRRQQPKTRGNGTGGPAKRESVFEPTADEAAMMKPPFNLTKEDVIAARRKVAASE